AVDVFTRGKRFEHQRRVPVVGRGDEDGVDVFPIKDAAEVARRLGVLVGERFRLGGGFVPDVAEGDNLGSRNLLKRLHEVSATAAGSDARNVDRFVRGEAAHRGAYGD